MNYEADVVNSLSHVLQKRHPMIAIQASALLLLKTFLSLSHGLPTMQVVYFDKVQSTIELQVLSPKIITMANKFCDKQSRTTYSKNEGIAAEHTDMELNYGLKTLLFMIICYQSSQDFSHAKKSLVQVTFYILLI